MNKTEAAKIIFTDLLYAGVFQSCWNCENFDRNKDYCDKFSTKPPTEIIIFSCGKDWCLDVPF
jgi:hypothetical protein